MKPLVRNNSLYGAISVDCAVTHRPTPVTSWRQTSIPVLFAAFSAALATGAPTYAFGLYASTLKASLHLSQSQLDTLGSANFCAGLLSWIPGLIVDHYGPQFAMTVGGTTMSLSLMGYWLVAEQFVEFAVHAIVPILCLLGVLIFMSNSLVIGSLFKALVVSCDLGSRGSAVGAAKGYVGLGAGVYSILFDAIRSTNESELDFLPMAAFFSVIAIALPGCFLLPSLTATRNHDMVDISSHWHYKVVYTGLLVLALWVLWTSAAFMFRPQSTDENEVITNVPMGDEDTHYLKAVMIVVAWFGPLLALFGLPHKHRDYTRLSTRQESKELFPDGVNEESNDEEWESVDESVEEFVDLNLKQMLQTTEAWLFLYICTVIVGSGTMMTNNMAQMVESRGFSKAASPACLALFSVSQAGARVLAGEFSERALKWNCPRPVFLTATSLLAVIGHAILTEAVTRNEFVAGVVLSGIAFGMVWPLMVLIVGDIFGVQHHGQNYMFYDGFTSAIGTLVVSKYIVQEVYEGHIDDSDGDGITCYGIECFQQSQEIVTILCLSCVVASVVMTVLTRKHYSYVPLVVE